MTNRSMELEVWGGDWGLPSIDMNCLQLLVYCNLSGAPVQVKVRNNPFRGALPTFRHGNITLHNLQDVISYLQSKNFYADHMLTKKNESEIQAYSQLLKEKLYPGLQFVWWVDQKNLVGLTKAWYAKKLFFPLNFYYPGHYEAQAKNFISAVYGSLEYDLTSIEAQVYGDAEKCLTLLSNRLGESKYFFGTQPTSLDAVVYSYLAPLLRAPFPNPALQNHLKACSNLVSFVIRISQKYFPTISEENGTKITVRGCALDSGSLTIDTEIIRMSHCGAFYFDGNYVRGCLLSCHDADACNSGNNYNSKITSVSSLAAAIFAICLTVYR